MRCELASVVGFESPRLTKVENGIIDREGRESPRLTKVENGIIGRDGREDQASTTLLMRKKGGRAPAYSLVEFRQ
jgi:hypothetical protein